MVSKAQELEPQENQRMELFLFLGLLMDILCRSLKNGPTTSRRALLQRRTVRRV